MCLRSPGRELISQIAPRLSHIDTAHLYGMGAVETLVGTAIAGRRDEVFLVSKVIPVEKRGFLMGLRNALAGLTAVGVSLYAGPQLIEASQNARVSFRERGLGHAAHIAHSTSIGRIVAVS